MEKSRSLFWRQFFPQGLSLGQAQLDSNWNSVRSPSLYHIHEWLSSEITYPSPVLSRTSNLLRAIRGFRNPNLQVALTRARDVCKFAIIKTRKKLGRVRFCKDFWDRFCGRAGQLLANFFALSPVTSQKSLYKITRDSFSLVSKKARPGLFKRWIALSTG